jgi:hypothetical protein
MKNFRLQGINIGLALAALITAHPAKADIIELNSFWAGSGTVSIDYNGPLDGYTPYHISGGSGGFKTYDLTTDPGRTNAFQSFCVDIFHGFNFAVQSYDTFATTISTISAQAAIDLGRLFTNYHTLIDSHSSSGTNEAAFQLAVWEIVNEGTGNYDLTTGHFQATGTSSALANSWLADLMNNPSDSAYTAMFWTVDSMITNGHGTAQDVVVFAPVPEPNIYSMMLVGLGLIGFTLRRRKQSEGTKFS